MIYNHNKILESFFWIGLYVCLGSFLCALLLSELHHQVIESPLTKNLHESDKIKEKKKDKKKKDGNKTKISIRSSLSSKNGFYRLYE